MESERVEKTYTIVASVEQLRCPPCGRTVTVEPRELRQGEDPMHPDAWRVSGWRTPQGWRALELPGGERAPFCPDCAPDIDNRIRKLVADMARERGRGGWVVDG